MAEAKPLSESTLCEQCQKNDSKYKCPGCLARTCSLACSKAHKDATGCSGKRNKTEFVKRAEYDANTMMSDYGFLQDLSRDHALLLRDAEDQGIGIKGPMGRTGPNRGSAGNSGPPTISLSRAQRNVVARAKEQRQVMIRYMSPGIKRHQQNKTIWMASKSRLVWTLEIAVPELAEQPNRWIENGLHDVCKLGDLWSRVLTGHSEASTTQAGDGGEDAPRKRAKTEGVRIQLPSDDGNEYPFKSSIPSKLRQTLRQSFGNTVPEGLVWLIRVQDVPANKPTFCRIDPLQPLFTQLRYQTVLEFPTIYVYSHVPETWDGHPVIIQEHCVAEDDKGNVNADGNGDDSNADAVEGGNGGADAVGSGDDGNVEVAE
ncbi:Box C/D snoRNA accumulation [Coemansia sp. RSA 2706]|nr:Box C/D snoRNA accumulation [Coemansia sp. RSA 2706]KAJ2317677.1 Box C/D snoRNA accumulation [Coemansia sp. RSA 2704]KAJ2328129.1 Box C/D snoRNA accumulation [Coemansia sp. RSA 2702]KAJ2364577.1 Box C/D snoRNA accumulation [Coemansia sp. RSA 2610]KAJ2383022.1 Box C/D snoRNA accumulation [Coemansia sp. RSA 2611]